MRAAPSTAPREFYEQNQLALVVGQVRFPELNRFDEEHFARDFADALREQYPLLVRDQAVNVIVSETGEVTRKDAGLLLRFSTIEKDYALVLAKDFVALECRRYTTFEDFIARLRHVLTLTREHFEVLYQLRVGLRYINEMRWAKLRTYEQWRAHLNADFMGWDPPRHLGGTVDHTLAEFALRREDGTYVLRRGFLKGSTVPHETPPAIPEYYLIDHDYSEINARKFEADPTERLRRYNDYMVDVFRKMTASPALQAFLHGKSDG